MHNLRVEIHSSLTDISPASWNALLHERNPFLNYHFLAALEQQHCLGSHTGWHPQHFIVRDAQGKLLGAAPTYLKTNGFGEFVFDWSWSAAYARAGLPYYPKLVVAVPFTPVSGARLLAQPDQTLRIQTALAQAIEDYAEEQQISSVHCLFPKGEDMAFLEYRGWLRRRDYQFHWHNQNYDDFDAFVNAFKARKRKKLRRERQYAQENGTVFKIKQGTQLSEQEIRLIHHLYQSTFDKKGNYAALTPGFFAAVAAEPEIGMLAVLAQQQTKTIAAAINFHSDSILYGRYWGCAQAQHSLHFETCFYQGIDYCIRHNLKSFEPGAQGEHKISRGFLPTPTWSAHYIRDARFRDAIADFLQREKNALQDYAQQWQQHLPFKTLP